MNGSAQTLLLAQNILRMLNFWISLQSAAIFLSRGILIGRFPLFFLFFFPLWRIEGGMCVCVFHKFRRNKMRIPRSFPILSERSIICAILIHGDFNDIYRDV